MNTTIRHFHPARSARRTAVATVALLATFAAAGCAGTSEPSSAPGALVDEAELAAVAAAGDNVAPDTPPAGAIAEPTEPSGDVTEDAAEDAADQLDDSAPPPVEQPPVPEVPDGDGDGGGGGGGDVDLPPAPNPAPHPCDFLVADGSSLAVGPDPLVLEPGDLSGTVTIVNCSDGDIDWTAKTKPSVALDDDGANLLPGETAELNFVIDGDQWDPGAIDFKIKVGEPGHNH